MQKNKTAAAKLRLTIFRAFCFHWDRNGSLQTTVDRRPCIAFPLIAVSPAFRWSVSTFAFVLLNCTPYRHHAPRNTSGYLPPKLRSSKCIPCRYNWTCAFSCSSLVCTLVQALHELQNVATNTRFLALTATCVVLSYNYIMVSKTQHNKGLRQRKRELLHPLQTLPVDINISSR